MIGVKANILQLERDIIPNRYVVPLTVRTVSKASSDISIYEILQINEMLDIYMSTLRERLKPLRLMEIVTLSQKACRYKTGISIQTKGGTLDEFVRFDTNFKFRTNRNVKSVHSDGGSGLRKVFGILRRQGVLAN